MPKDRPGRRVTRLKKRHPTRTRDRSDTGPAEVIPLGAPRTTALAPSKGARLITRRTSTPGLSMTLSIGLDDIMRAAVAAEKQRLREGERRPPRETQDTSRGEPSSAGDEASHAPELPALDVLPHLYGRDSKREARFQRDMQTNACFLLRGRAGAIVRAVLGRAPALKGLGDLATYRTIMETWEWLPAAVRATRSYQAGLDLGLLLLRVVELHQLALARQEVASHRRRLYWFILDMLDRLDQWDVYLATWARVRALTTETLTYQAGARHVHGTRLVPFIMGENAGGLTVHFLWPTLHRKELIERKVARRRRGQKLGNVTHATQDELSTDELGRRLSWVAHQARELS